MQDCVFYVEIPARHEPQCLTVSQTVLIRKEQLISPHHCPCRACLGVKVEFCGWRLKAQHHLWVCCLSRILSNQERQDNGDENSHLYPQQHCQCWLPVGSSVHGNNHSLPRPFAQEHSKTLLLFTACCQEALLQLCGHPIHVSGKHIAHATLPAAIHLAHDHPSLASEQLHCEPHDLEALENEHQGSQL